MLTKEQAVALPIGGEVWSLTEENADGTPRRARKNGKVKTWQKRPRAFRMPVKFGLYGYGYLDETNAWAWALPENHVDNGGPEGMIR